MTRAIVQYIRILTCLKSNLKESFSCTKKDKAPCYTAHTRNLFFVISEQIKNLILCYILSKLQFTILLSICVNYSLGFWLYIKYCVFIIFFSICGLRSFKLNKRCVFEIYLQNIIKILKAVVTY